jgi:hypothetical protein
MRPPDSELEREADTYEWSLHRKSATRGFLVGGSLCAVGALLVLVTGVAYVGMLWVPGIVLLVSAWTHREKAQRLEARMREAGRGPGGR